ncbi:protein kinase [Nocardia sp. NPDC051787]|uniref:protein kinase domain-containing protein n=1 Tax=Nocardia sp. NPDC051787 TaxID=3155415 RepID=UPI00341D3F03
MTADRLIAGRYRLTDPIGTGAMGVVWRATDVRLQRTVAVKQLLLGPGLSGSAALEAKLRAMREGRIAARLHHPNAITVFDVAEEDGQPWLVMEYLDAPSLAAKLSGNRTLPAVEVAKIGAQAASALAAAHDAGIMHRDVKPANLLVADDGTVKITDFGISRAVGDVTVTATGFLAGTPAYLAPEVARGENPEPASDVFALGSTLYAAVQGSPPFGEGDNPLALLHAVARAEIPPPESAGPLAPVLMRLLAPTIDARPTMHEAKEALEAVAADRNPELPAPVTMVMPAPGAAATTVLPQRAVTASAGKSGDNGATAVAPGAVMGPPAPPVAAQRPPIAWQGRMAATLPGVLVGSNRGRMLAIAAAAVVGVLILAGIVATVSAGDRDGDGATPTSAVVPPGVAAENSPPSADSGRPVPQQAPAQAPAQAPGPATAASTSGSASVPTSGPAPATTSAVAPPPPAPATTPPATPTPGPSSASPTPTPSPQPTTPPATSTTTGPATTATTTQSGPPTSDRVASFIQGYYGMLPGNVSGAWTQLSPGYQAQTGYDSYVNFWGTIRAVRVGSVTQNGANRAVVALTYTLKNGTTTSENRWIEVVGDSAKLQIAASGT